MHTPLILDEVGEQLLVELLGAAAPHAAPRVSTLEEGKVCLGTHIGLRRHRNEDRVAVARIDIPDQCSYSISIVCDGVGSSKRGDEAAAIACAAMISLLSTNTAYRQANELLPEIVRGADDIIRQRLGGSGLTTVCALLATSRRDFSLTNVGDSRAYSWDHNSDLIQLTEDDTLENEMKRLNLPARSFLNERGLEGSLSQALGESGRASSDLRIKTTEQKNAPPGGVLLASDGAWVGGEDTFQKVAKNCASPGDLVRRVLTSASWLGGVDNASAVAISDPQTLPTAPAATGRHTRITVWLPDTKVVVYRTTAQPSLEATDNSKGPGKRSTKRKGKKSEASPDQLELPNGEAKGKPGKIVAGPDDN